MNPRSLWLFIAGRAVRCLVTLWLAVSLVFMAHPRIPGDPAEAAMGQQMTRQGVALLRNQMGLDQPLLEQYFRYLGQLAHGNLGLSLALGRPVSELLLQVAPYTAFLVLGALLDRHRGRRTARHRIGAVQELGGRQLRAAALAGRPGDPRVRHGHPADDPVLGVARLVPGGGRRQRRRLLEPGRFAALPALAGGLGMAAYLTRLARATVLDLMKEDFVRTARAKGLSEAAILYKHVLRNALISDRHFSRLLRDHHGGRFIAIEIVFSRPGFGRLIMGGIQQRDYVVLQSVLLIYVLLSVLINLLVDVLYVWIDPRIKLTG